MRQEYDLAIIGYGPAGEVLASTVGAAGLRVLVVERWPQPYPLPRLTTLDGECIRIVQATSSDVDRGFKESTVQDCANFADANDEPIMVVRYPGKIGGWPARMNIFQPDFEAVIAEKVDAMDNVDVRRGWDAVDFVQDDDGVTLTLQAFEPATMTCVGETQTVRARYLVGCDGARSSVRTKSNLPVRDFNMHERWLNFDAELKRPLDEKFNKLVIFMDPARPHMYMPIGERYLRLEFRVMEHESDESVTDPAVAWDFLTRKHGLGPDDVRIMRQVVYHYHTRITGQWRDRRVFVAGDAAHTMPPYMGQGGCAALRDGRNLGWKLVEVLQGRSDPSVLDTYQEEREPHVTTLVMASDMLSRTVNIVDPVAAAARDKGMRETGERTPPDLPSLSAGVLRRTTGGEVGKLGGKMTPQGYLRRAGDFMRGDDLLGAGFQLWCLKDPEAHLGDRELAWLKARNAAIAVFEEPNSPNYAEDRDGDYVGFLRNNDVEFVLVRPDFYVFAAGALTDLNAVIGDLAAQLRSELPAGSPVIA